MVDTKHKKGKYFKGKTCRKCGCFLNDEDYKDLCLHCNREIVNKKLKEFY